MAIHVWSELLISELPEDCIAECSASGQVAGMVAYWCEKLEFTVDRENATKYLSGFGAWDAEELASLSAEDIAEKVLWLACGTFSEWDGTASSDWGSDVIYLEA